MSTVSFLIALPLLVIFSYVFDLIAKQTKFPAVILLMGTGIIARLVAGFYGQDQFVFLDDLIPVLGTIGLILIVLEGALELEISWEKFPIISKGFLAAAVILLLNIIGVALFFEFILGLSDQQAVIYAIPLSVISSAVAIPSSAGLPEKQKEFIVYESTFSDILGIMAFNYTLRQLEKSSPLIELSSLTTLGLQIFVVIAVSILITYGLFQLLQKIDHHVKFFLILSLLILVYAVGKIFHLPALVTIFIFGLFLSNVQSLLPKRLQRKIDLDKTHKGLHEFHVLTAESTFLVKTFFFLFFGFSVDVSAFTSFTPLLYGLGIFIIMLGLRYVYFLIVRFELKPSALVYISPRGLISILLFLQIGKLDFLPTKDVVVDSQVLLVVILLSMLAMTRGTMQKEKATLAEDTIPVPSPPENILDSPPVDDDNNERAIDILMNDPENKELDDQDDSSSFPTATNE